MFQMRLTMILFLLLLLGVNCDTQMLRCDKQDQSSLLRLKYDLVFNRTLSLKLKTWNSSFDCCVWDGVTCRADGHVIAIDLYDQSISGGIDDSKSPLFDLDHLQLLDLSWNDFNGTQIPSGIGKLVNLLHLDLSYSFFRGQVPAEISSLTSLLSLGLTSDYLDETRVGLKLEKPKLSELIGNMTRLTELRLDGMNMSAESEGHAWGRALSSYLPRLQVLSLVNCSLSGPLHVSLIKLQALTYIDLSRNNLSSEIPELLPKFSNLTSLSLSYCGLYGKLPPFIFSMATLQILNLQGNNMLYGTLPETIGNTTTLTDLYLSGCGFSGSITNIRSENLENLDLSDNALNGAIPLSLFSLPSLWGLYLSGNQFNGFSVDEFPIVTQSPLVLLALRGNKLEGPIHPSLFNLHKLEWLDLSYNNFSGTVDLSNLFQNLGNLSRIDLSFNSLSVIESVDSTIYFSFPRQLYKIYLASCNLKAFPSLLTNHSTLDLIDLSHNNIVGETPNWIWKPNLDYLNLSHNSLTGFEGPSPNLTFPSFLRYLDLSSNLLQGQISLAPLGVGYALYLEFLSLSNNNFHGAIPPSLCNISTDIQPIIDLSKNLFSGTVPSCLTAMNFGVLNLKRNHLTGNIPNAFHDRCSLQTLDLSDNHLQGTVPKSMMNCKALEVINLGNNGLYDEFPLWLMNVSSLRVLVLRSNKFHGLIRYETSKQASGWANLQIIDIASNNYFEGSIPPSVGGLTSLYALNLSHNRFTGYIPSSLGNLKTMESLDLANNRISGVIPDQLASLTFISYLNLSYNKLIGRIPTSTQLQSFSEWSYIGNRGLHGPPLDEVSCGSSCGSGVLPLDPTSTNVGKEINWELICVEIGYVIGLGAVIGSFVFWRRWRFWFFERVDRLLLKVFPQLDPKKRNHGKRV